MLSALISLECTVDDGNNYNSTYTTNGSVRVPRLGCYYSGDICSKNPVSTGARAHAYGEMTLSPDCGRYSEIADILHSKYEYPSYCRQDLLEFSYRFFEYNRDDTQEAFPHFTNRIITAACGDCIEYDQVGDHGNVKLGDTSAWNFTYTNNTINDSIAIPVASLGTGGTTYIYRDKNVPAEASTEAYGDRGLWMWAYKNAGGPEKPKFYQCPVTVSVVSNVTQPAHDLSDEVARVAVASIALQGQWHQGTLKHPIWSQYQFYAMG